ncbi:MAG TPA: hypothetical protein VM367_13625 [Pseudonocardia sp.]|nr:hypothetical protein [Pseudonocardia sp.]
MPITVSLPELFLGSDAVAAGLLTPDQLRGPGVRRLFRNLYAPACVRVTHELRSRGATRILPADAVVTGRSAACVRGVQLAYPDDPVEIVAPLARRLVRRSGIDLRRTEVEPDESVPWAWGRLATPLRMALDLLLDRPLPKAVADLDAVVRAGAVDLAEVAALVRARSDRGIVAARRAVALADPRAEVPPESEVRVWLMLAGLEPVPQYWVEDASGRIARVDLAFPAQRVAVEYDGQWRDGQLWALNHDRSRLNRVHAAGWEVVFVTAPLLARPARMVAEVEGVLRSRS